MALELTPFATMLLYPTAAGVGIPLGALLARVPRLHPRWLESEFKHFVMAFGGGVLVAAVGLVLIPDGSAFVGSPFASTGLLLLGGGLFFWLERLLARRKRGAPFLLATLLDYIPESLALGAAFAVGASGAPLLALLIGLQNLPEGFNAWRELARGPGTHQRRALLGFFALVPLGPALAALGWLTLADHTEVIGAIMLLASGGILYIVFQDIAPNARIKAQGFPALGAVCGFAVALLGQQLLGG